MEALNWHRELEGMRSNLTGIDLFTDLAEKVSASMTNKEVTRDVSIPVEDSVQGKTSSPAEAFIPIGNGKELKKEKNAKSERVKRRGTKKRCPILRMNLCL